MPFTYKRTIRFQDTDSAGVMYFTNTLAICHEAYEESLAESGIQLRNFFAHPELAIPITHASVDYFRPSFCGTEHVVQLIPNQLSAEEFEIDYALYSVENPNKLVSQALTKHVCIHRIKRKRLSLPQEMLRWLSRWSDTPMNDAVGDDVNF